MTRHSEKFDPSENSPLQDANLSRRDVLKLAGATSLLGLLALTPRAQRAAGGGTGGNVARPNIVYMHSHDTGRYIEPYGHRVSTPNLKRFADEGTLFLQAYSASPTCSPSRASLHTGMTPGCNGMWGLAHKGYTLNDYGQGLVPFLKGAGYSSALVGVQHIASGTPEACGSLIGYDRVLPTFGIRAHQVADAAVRFLERPPKGPFFLDVGFAETHLLKDRGETRFGYARGNPDHALIPANLSDTFETRRDMADYGVAVGALDSGMGRVLNALEQHGLTGNTLVIITTDHGIPLPGLKANHTDGGLGVMLMLRGPGGFTGGKVSNALVSQIDIFPTLCELLDLPAPAWLQGRSLMPLVRGETDEINEAVYAEHEAHAVKEPQASVRTARYRYIRRLDGDEQVRPRNTDWTFTKELWLEEGWANTPLACEALFDLYEDPAEQHNLIADAGYESVLSELRGLMVARMERFENPLLRGYNVVASAPLRQV